MAIIARAMLYHRPTTFTPILTANFMSRCTPGSAQLQVEKIASSRQFDRYQAILHQNGKECIRALGTFANRTGGQAFDRYESDPVDVAPLSACIPMPAYTLFSQMDVRIDPATAGWMMDRLTEKSDLKGWIKFKTSQPYSLPKTILMADAFPPPIFASQGMVDWVPTIEFSINIRQLPTTEWLKCAFRTRFITGGLLEEDGQVWDESGALIAISRQIAQFRPTIKTDADPVKA